MRLIFVRHGETDYNKKNIVQGQSDAKLNRTGIMQARRLGKRLANENIDIVFCSDLSRARQTAKEILKHHKNVPIKYNKLLRERAFGIFEHKPSEHWRSEREKTGIPRHLYKPKGAENFHDIKKRVKKFLRLIYPKYKNKTVLVVSHGGINRTLINILTKRPLREVLDGKQDNTCVNIVELSGRSNVVVHKINCTEHLDANASKKF